MQLGAAPVTLLQVSTALAYELLRTFARIVGQGGNDVGVDIGAMLRHQCLQTLQAHPLQDESLHLWSPLTLLTASARPQLASRTPLGLQHSFQLKSQV
jgi:hypothetical protein